MGDLAPFWYPVAFAHEVGDKTYETTQLDERLVIYRVADGSLAAARDLCCHRGAPLSLGHVEGDEIICKYHGLRYDRSGKCTSIPAHPHGAISPRLRLKTFPVQERFNLIWVRRKRLRLRSSIKCSPKASRSSNVSGRKIFPSTFMPEAHFPADRSSISYRRGLAALGLGRSYTA